MAASVGHFEGKILTEWGDDGRLMRLIEPFRYIDAAGLYWDVPAGFETDGATIPQLLHSVTGGPFTGKFRKAAVPHDYYCVARVRRWEDTHRMFWQAMLCAGVGESFADLMYKAVYLHGPRWYPDKTDMVYEYVEEW